MQKILVIQTAFIGDVVLATAVVEKLKQYFPGAQVDFLLRKGNESLLQHNPHINEVLIWNKKEKKIKNLLSTVKKLRARKYDAVINLQRFFATGFLTAFSGAKQKIGFDKNPLSFMFTKSVKHIISTTPPYRHEVERNNDLIKDFTDDKITRPTLYPSSKDFESVQSYCSEPYITVSPRSVWFTKGYPLDKWKDFLDRLDPSCRVFLLGGPDDKEECELLKDATTHPKVTVLAGQLSFLQSAALMKTAVMNYANDSAPLHFASGVNAPVTAVFCSTVQSFGFTPLSDISFVAEIRHDLYCRPCGLHGKKECPEKHFRCAYEIAPEQLLETYTLQQ